MSTPVTSAVIAEVRALALAIDIVVVDDGSTDATGEIAELVGAKVLRLPFNLGYGAAVQTVALCGRGRTD